MSLAPLLDHHAFVDLETTGLDGATDEVIELGVLFVERGVPVERISRLFRPSRGLSPIIERITGLSDQMLVAQPPFSSYAPALQQQLAGWTVVAHNAPFEQSFLGGALDSSRVLDSCELLHYLFPELPSHSLDALIPWAGIGRAATHRALKDCEDTFAVMAHALSRFVDEGRADDLSDLRAALVQPEVPSALSRMLEALERARPEGGARSAVDPIVAPSPSAAIHALAKRDEVGRAVSQVLEDGGRLVVETARTDPPAYFASAAEYAARTGQRVAIAVGSRSLRRALLEQGGASVGRSGVAPLNSQSAYVCRRRALFATRVSPSMTHEERAPRAYLRAFLRRSTEGELDSLSHWFRDRYPILRELISEVRSAPEATLRERCPHFRTCFFHSARARAHGARVLVSPHSLALEWPEDYPAVDAVILDEAERLEDSARSSLRQTLREEHIRRLGCGVRRLALELESGSESQVDVLANAGTLDRAWRALSVTIGETLGPTQGVARMERSVDAVFRQTVQGGRLALQLERAMIASAGFANSLEKARRVACVGQGLPEIERELASAASEARRMAELLQSIAQSPSDERVDSIALDERGVSVTRQGTQLSVAIERAGLTRARALVLVSELPGEVWALRRLGLDGPDLRSLSPSPPEGQRERILVLRVTDAQPSEEWVATRLGELAMHARCVLGVLASPRHVQAVWSRLDASAKPRVSLLDAQRFGQGETLPGAGLVFVDGVPRADRARESSADFSARARVMLRRGIARLIGGTAGRMALLITDPTALDTGQPGRDALAGHVVIEASWAEACARAAAFVAEPSTTRTERNPQAEALFAN